ncbi:MAG TPA: methyltransferase [Cyclobacteriaceae bacterium]|nr:methyltransferase [Cyclobacteriaceae bacterium]
MPLKPNLIERLLINNGIIPTALLDTCINLFQASALLTAGDIRLFNHLKEASLTLEEVSQKTNCSLHGLQVLLTCMITLGYINKKENKYCLSTAMQRSFPIDLFPGMVPFFRALNENLNNATEAVKTNPRGGLMGYDMMKEGEVATSFQVAMRWLGESTVKEVVSRLTLSGSPKRMLDIGGSHGLYCVEFCRKYPGLKATVLDWAIGLENAKITLSQETDVANRIDLVEADFEKESLPSEKYDFMFLGNIIHGLDEANNQILFKKVADATASNGTIAILDQYSNVKGSLFVKGVASLIGWNLFLFAGGRAYDFDVVKQWLETFGFHSVTLTHLKRSPGFSFITARKK